MEYTDIITRPLMMIFIILRYANIVFHTLVESDVSLRLKMNLKCVVLCEDELAMCFGVGLCILFFFASKLGFAFL